MRLRAAAAASTGERILDAVEKLFLERPTDQISLADVAQGAGVTVQTVIRRFGGKEGLLLAAAGRVGEDVLAQRLEAPIGDVRGAVGNLAEHYEQRADTALKLLGEEDRVAALRPMADNARAVHREWVERTFGPFLRGLRGAARRRRVAELVAICDVYTWKLLRRQAGLSRAETERALIEMLEPLTEGAAP
jgi:AcrR family transcriptional regulator